ncbi:hypothetical protein Ancab_013556 [Ancistrocladus abbreviatus]
MAIRKVYGSLSCPATLRVLASLFEHDLDFEFLPVDLDAGEHTTQAFLSLNPFGEIPAFQDDDLILFESRAMMRYMAFQYPQPGREHIFKDPLIQGVVACWIDVEDHQFSPPATKLITELVINPKNGLASNAVVVAEELAKLAKVLDVYEEQLTESKYLGGEKFTSADVTHLPCLYYLLGIESTRQLIESRPHVAAWGMEIMARPAWVKVEHMINSNA